MSQLFNFKRKLMTMHIISLADEAATLDLGRTLAKCITKGLVIYLEGDLGAGKTTLTRGILQGLGVEGRVKSPTYTLVEPYVVSGLYLYHFDLYRFSDPVEWEEAGFRDYFRPDSVCLVEWPDKGAGYLPAPDVLIRLTVEGTGRTCAITSERLFECLKKHLTP